MGLRLKEYTADGTHQTNLDNALAMTPGVGTAANCGATNSPNREFIAGGKVTPIANHGVHRIQVNGRINARGRIAGHAHLVLCSSKGSKQRGAHRKLSPNWNKSISIGIIILPSLCWVGQ